MATGSSGRVSSGRVTLPVWTGRVVLVGCIAIVIAAVAVLGTRWLFSTEWAVGFLNRFPGQYELPADAPVGLPAWLGWQHFFNTLLVVLIIRSGIQIRRETRPPAYWSSRRQPARRLSITLWFHLVVDMIWMLNGALFLVLLFTTKQWMRIVPSSLDVFPNALSALLQYMSLNWPTENGWVNYNALQQLAYFSVVFLAAPLSAVTGLRMSPLWDGGSTKLDKAFPLAWARAIHFPVMIYFVVFICVHVVLVLATGALRNLNHVYAALGSRDPGEFASNWTGFWLFVLSIVIVGVACLVARPVVLTSVARPFGTVSAR